MNNLKSSNSRSQMSSKSDTVNKEEISVTNVSLDKNWQNWNLPLVPQNKIYKKITFSNTSFLSNYIIKIVKRTYSLRQSFKSLQLLNRYSIEKCSKNFSFIHFGLVQVTVKPLTKKWLNTSVLLCLRDGRLKIYKDALLGMVESSIFQRPIYFNYYPNFTVSLTDETILQTLELDIKTSYYNMLEDAQPLVILYRIYYKLIKTTLESQALMESPKSKTLLLQTSTDNSHTWVPTQIY